MRDCSTKLVGELLKTNNPQKNQKTTQSAVSLDVESYSAFINYFHKCKFYTNISILAAVSHDDEHAAPSSIFSDEIDCNKFISISKATKEKRQIFVKKCFFLAVVYFYIVVMYSCVRGA